MGEPQVPTTFERSASAAEYPPAGAGFQRKPLVHQNKKGTPAGAIFYFGGPDRDRTGDLTDANRTLSHLSYRPIIRAPEQVPMLCVSYFIIAGVSGEFKGEKSRSVIVLEPFDGYLRIDGRTNGQSVLIVADLGVMSAEQVSFLL